MLQTGLFIAEPAINRDMIIEYDRAKNLRNITQRGLPFDAASQFDFVSATFELDRRHEYGEHRVRAVGKIRGRVHVLVFTEIPGGIRVISLRKANPREVRRYETKTRS
jgi:uncharacterized DUF497 family protein